MSADSEPRGPLSPSIRGASAVRNRDDPQLKRRASMKRQWLVRLDTGDERVDADDVEITASGALVFYRLAARMESERTLLTAFAPGLWRGCQLESDG